MDNKSPKNQNWMANFWEVRKNAVNNIKKARFYTIFLNCAKYELEPELEPEPKLFQSQNWNRNKSLQLHNTSF